MKSLYDLLGARENDDADALKKAFRRAIKANHPDLHPGDPDAAERFREIIAANACLRDAKQRATYDLLLQLERQRSQTPMLKRLQRRSILPRQQLRSKRMRATAVIAAVSALIGGYGLWATMPTTGNVKIDKGELAAAGGAPVEKQTATVVAAARENENPSAVMGAAKAEADEPVEPVGGVRMQPANPTDQGEQRHRHDSAAVPNGASEPSSTPSATNSSASPDIAERELALGPLSNNANVYTARGIASYRSGDFQQAIASFNAAIRLDPDDAQAYGIRGNAWDEMGSFESALADYDEAIRINPNNPAVFHDRAIMWRHKGELDKALIDLDRAIRFSFSDASIYCDRGLVWYENGHHDRAIADFNQAVKLDPNSAAACIKRGLILHRNSEFKPAFAGVNQAIRIDPSIVDALRPANLRP